MRIETQFVCSVLCDIKQCVHLSTFRIHEHHSGSDLSFKQIAKGFLSKGFLDPTDGMFRVWLVEVIQVIQVIQVCWCGKLEVYLLFFNDSVCCGHWIPCVCLGGEGGYCS